MGGLKGSTEGPKKIADGQIQEMIEWVNLQCGLSVAVYRSCA